MKNYLLIFLPFLHLNACQNPVKKAKIPIKVVVVNMFEPGNDEGDRPGEFQYWVETATFKRYLTFSTRI